MNNIFEASGKTVEEALDAACALAGVSLADADVEIIDAGAKGIFGIGGKDARVRLIVTNMDEGKSSSAVKIIEPSVPEAIRTKPKSSRSDKERPSAKPRHGEDRHSEDRRNESRHSEDRKPAAVVESKKPEEPAIILSEEEVAIATEKALGFLQPIFAQMQVEPSHQVSYQDGMLLVAFSGEGLGSLIGRRGETLNALQYLTNLVINKAAAQHVRLVLDVENYRQGREDTLAALALKMAEKVVRTGRRVELEPMNPHERRIVHMTLQDDDRVSTVSKGEEPYRRVVVVKKGGHYRG